MIVFCDVDILKVVSVVEVYGIDNVKVYDDYKVLLKDDMIDVIYVCMLNDLYCEIIVVGLYVGKYVMCEKLMVKMIVEV